MDKKDRNSSIELLRIICMIFIIAHHFSVHGNFETITVNTISINTIFIQILSIWGKMACNIFMLITGYFMIKSKFNIKKMILLIFEMIFYSVGIVCIISIFKIQVISLKDIIKACLSIFYGNWFLINYLIIYILVPFLNEIINRFDKKKMKDFILLLIILFCIIPTFALNSKFEFNNIDIMIIMYVIGAYIRLYIDERNKNIYLNGTILLNSLLVLSVLGFDLLGYILNKDNLLKNATYFSKINSIIVVLGAILTFLYFSRNLKFNSKIINYIATSVLGVYLIHDNEYIRNYIWKLIIPNSNFINTPYFIAFAVCKIIIVFVVCCIIDKIRYYLIEKNISRLLDKILYKIEKRFNLGLIDN